MGNKFFSEILIARDKRRHNIKYKNFSRKEIFENIYKTSAWGKNGDKFYSGPGSHDERYVASYCDTIAEFIIKNNVKSVIDLGCGDFNVASRWLKKIKDNNKKIDYTGIDIVEDLINSHNKNFASDNIRFLCRDAVSDELPDGELCIIREVLQHYNNGDILKIIKKLEKYKYVIVTESRTMKEYAREFNIDTNTGAEARGRLASGIYLDEEPFNLKVKNLLQVPGEVKKGALWRSEMATFLIEN